VPGILQRLPRLFQKQALLRIHVRGLNAGDAKEHRIEPVHPFDEAAMPAVRSGRGILIIRSEVEARDRFHQVTPVHQVIP